MGWCRHKFKLLAAEGGVCAQLVSVTEFVHFGLTSQDVNNTCYPLMILDFYKMEYMPTLTKVLTTLDVFARKWKDVPLLARTHGQAASPTRMGKEIYVFVDRLKAQIEAMEKVPFNAKFGGATGLPPSLPPSLRPCSYVSPSLPACVLLCAIRQGGRRGEAGSAVCWAGEWGMG